MVRRTTPAPAFELSGGALCLDFANTVNRRRSRRAQELLESYRDLVAWSRQTGVVRRREAKALLGEGARRPEAAAAVLRRARGLRETLFALFAGGAAGKPPAGGDLAALNAALRSALPLLRVTSRGGGEFAWAWRWEGAALDPMLGPVVRSAAELLTSPDLERVRECAAETCGWLFLDHSRNQSRRWCDMKVCGNRAKARRYYARQKARR